jgi:VanZ family protein
MDESKDEGRGAGSPKSPSFLSLWAPPLAYTALIFVLAVVPVGVPPKVVGGQDKVAHFLEYALLSALLLRALRGRFGAAASFALSVLLAASLGALTEIVQAVVPGRSAEPWDGVANALGAAAGGLVMALFARGRGKQSEDPAPDEGDGSN